ncbi:MAG: hypothetical protein ACFHU9_09455 [Fluviicola sp.]
MRTNIHIGIPILLALTIFGCGNAVEERKVSKKERYESQLSDLKTELLPKLKEKFDLLNQFRDSFFAIEEVHPPEEHKELQVRTGVGERKGEDFNTLFLNSGYFLENAPFPISYYKHLDNIERLVNGEALVWEERDAYPITELNKFILFCESFASAEYTVLERALQVQDPDRVAEIVKGNNEAFTSGYYKTFVALYKFDSSIRLLDNFVLLATNDTEVKIQKNLDLTYNLLKNVRAAIQKEMQLRYSFSGEIPYRM